MEDYSVIPLYSMPVELPYTPVDKPEIPFIPSTEDPKHIEKIGEKKRKWNSWDLDIDIEEIDSDDLPRARSNWDSIDKNFLN